MTQVDQLRQLLSPLSESSVGHWSDEDLLTAVKILEEEVVQAQHEQIALQREATAERARINQELRANNEAAEAALRAEFGGTLLTSSPRITEVKSSDNQASRKLREIDSRWQLAKENEEAGLGALRRHYIAANKRAAKAEVYRQFEEHALAAVAALRQLNAMSADRESLCGERLVGDTWLQAVVPCEPALASGTREYASANSASWLYRGESEPPTLAQKFINRSRADFEKLLGGKAKIDWTSRRAVASMPPIRVDQRDAGRGSW